MNNKTLRERRWELELLNISEILGELSDSLAEIAEIGYSEFLQAIFISQKIDALCLEEENPENLAQIEILEELLPEDFELLLDIFFDSHYHAKVAGEVLRKLSDDVLLGESSSLEQ